MLSELPNIGAELEKRLLKINIRTVKDLKDTGSIGALQKLNAINHPGCINMLYALEGAIQGIRWHALAPEIKSELKKDLQELQQRLG